MSRKTSQLLAGSCALALAVWSSSALAADYSAIDNNSVRTDIGTANGDGDPSSTITLGNDVTMMPGTLPAVTKDLTIDSGSFTFLKTYASGTANQGVLGFGPETGTVTLKGSITGVAAASGNAAGQSGLNVAGQAMVINYATIITGNGSGTLGSGIGFTLQNGATLTNYGTATVGSATGNFGAAGAFMMASTLINNGTILAGTGSSGGGAGVSTSGSASTITNNGTIRAGNGTAGAGGNGATLAVGSSLSNNAGAILAGGDGSTSGGPGVSITSPTVLISVTNSGTITGGNGATIAGGDGVRTSPGWVSLTNTGTIQGGNGATSGGWGVNISGFPGHLAVLNNSGTIKGGDGSSTGGVSGAGIIVHNGVGTITNSGTITGGAGGVAVANSGGSVSLINSGTLQEGAGSSTAILMQGGQNLTLELDKGSVITGNVLADATAVANTLILGGDDDAGFDVSKVGPQYQNFTAYQKTGNSTWTLTGTGTASTPWAIQQGTLQIGDGATVLGDIADNAALAFGNSNALTFANVITGTGSVNQVGSGTTNLAGTSTYSGPTIVSGGTLSVNGTLTNSAVTVQSGGTLGGNGTVQATTIQSGGAIAPGNSVGTLHINGAFVQSAGSVYQLQVDPNSSASDLIAVNGAATLASGAGLNVGKIAPGDYQLGTVYTVLTATNGVNGTYTLSGQTMAVSPYIGLKDSYDADNAYLTVVQTADPATASQTGNQTQTATGTDSLPSGSSVGTGVLNTADPAATRSAFDQLSGEALASAKGVLVSGSVLVRDTTFDRLRDVLCATGDDANQSDRRNNCASDQPALWAQGFGNWGTIGGNGNAAGLTQSTGGFLVGADVPVHDWRIGYFGGFSRTAFDVKARDSWGVSDNYHLGAYAGTAWGGLGLRLGASYSWNNLATERSVTVGALSNDLRANYDAGTTQIFGELGRRFAVDTITLEPFANLAYVNLRTDGFRETGGDAALTAKAGTQEDGFSTLGVRPSTAISWSGFDATARGMIGWRHTFGSVTPSSIVSFANSSSFTIEGAPIARDAGVVEAGLDFALAHSITAGLTYGGQFGSGETDNGVRGALTIAF